MITTITSCYQPRVREEFICKNTTSTQGYLLEVIPLSNENYDFKNQVYVTGSPYSLQISRLEDAKLPDSYSVIFNNHYYQGSKYIHLNFQSKDQYISYLLGKDSKHELSIDNDIPIEKSNIVITFFFQDSKANSTRISWTCKGKKSVSHFVLPLP